MKTSYLIAVLPASALLLASCDSETPNAEAGAQVVASEPAALSSEANNPPAMQPADQGQIFTPVESSSSLMTRAETFQGCSIAAGTLAAISFNNDPQKSKALLQEGKLLHEIAVGYVILTGSDEEVANDLLKSQKYAESEILSEVNEGINVKENIDLLIASYHNCNNLMRNAAYNEDATLAHIVKNFTR